jgi:tRNA-splicing endonuclease subunit Sen34
MDGQELSPLQRTPDLPVPISLVAGRYLLFDIDAAIYLRRAHNICGHNIGTLHLIPSQNGFLGLPVILMPEEAQLLVDQDIAYVIDDPAAHERALATRAENPSRIDAYRADVQRQADAIGEATASAQAEKKRRALAKQRSKAQKIKPNPDSQEATQDFASFDDAESVTTEKTSSYTPANTFFVTPTSSRLLVPPQPADAVKSKPILPNVPLNYPLFRHLHSRGYFMTPGLRFGCQYTTYPGDPLRFHSHFLTADFGWNKEINLMDIVGGGRLGTGVKKGFLIGGHAQSTREPESGILAVPQEDEVRTFSIEWAVM